MEVHSRRDARPSPALRTSPPASRRQALDTGRAPTHAGGEAAPLAWPGGANLGVWGRGRSGVKGRAGIPGTSHREPDAHEGPCRFVPVDMRAGSDPPPGDGTCPRATELAVLGGSEAGLIRTVLKNGHLEGGLDFARLATTFPTAPSQKGFPSSAPTKQPPRALIRAAADPGLIARQDAEGGRRHRIPSEGPRGLLQEGSNSNRIVRGLPAFTEIAGFPGLPATSGAGMLKSDLLAVS